MSLSYVYVCQVMGHLKDAVEMIDFRTDLGSFGKRATRCLYIAAQPGGPAEVPRCIRARHMRLRELLERETRQRDGARKVAVGDRDGRTNRGDPAPDFGLLWRSTGNRRLRGRCLRSRTDVKCVLDLLKMPFSSIMLPAYEQ